MSIPAVPGVVQGPRELYRAPDPSGIFELVDRLGEGSYGAVYKVSAWTRKRGKGTAGHTGNDGSNGFGGGDVCVAM